MKVVKVSVLMSIYQKESVSNFRECMESILAQTCLPNEIVLVKDGPLTKELEVAIDYYASHYSETFTVIPLSENQGLGRALNIGVESCHNDLIARMDTDDIMEKDRLETQYNYFVAHPELSLLGTSIIEFDQTLDNLTGKRVAVQGYEAIKEFSKRRNPFNHMTVMFKKEAVLAAGNYLPLEGFEDYYLWVRVLKMGSKVENLPSFSVYARAGKEMLARRGGWQYWLRGIKGRWKIYRTGYGRITDLSIVLLAHTAVSLVPGSIRIKIYNTVLRKK